MTRRRCVLLAITLVWSCVAPLLAAGGDASGAARPGHLPFDLPLVTSESHISSARHADSLMKSKLFDTTYTRKSILDAITHEEDTYSFAKWIEHTLEEEHAFRTKLEHDPLWTILGQSIDHRTR
jgi:hypothetical protein